MILAFDTSAAHCAVAIISPNHQLSRSEQMSKGQAERLLPMIEELMSEAQITWADFDRIAVGTGPGNFTGIRIAVALARGLALGLGIPAIGVTGFQARADLVDLNDYWVTIPAPRDQIYVQGFGAHDCPAKMIAGDDFDPMGAAALTMSDLAPEDLACAIGHVARRATDTMRPAPFYLRAADALPSADPPPVILP
jgi:tRNA threonylcarbamoyladenosine biosynthesis protein TsaB